MRRTILVLAGALLLQLSLMSAAQAIVVPPKPTYDTTTTTTTTLPTTTTTTTTTTSTTTTTTTTTTTLPTTSTSVTTTTVPVPDEGTFTIEPDSGVPGTLIRAESVTPSPLEGEQFAVLALIAVDEEEPTAVMSVAVDDNGAWAGSIAVPNSAEPGDYVVDAQVFTDADSFSYAAVPFEVLVAPSRPRVPPAVQPPPVVRTPSLTG